MFKPKHIKSIVVLAVIFAGLFVVGCKKGEHPSEHPEDKAAKTAMTKDQLANAVESYVEKTASKTGGYFVAFDDKTKKDLKLTLDKVHRKRLAKVGDDMYFACADFTTPDGQVYDLDVFMKGKSKDQLVFSKFTVHKEAGKERYTWVEQDGVWKTKAISDAGKEHPKEHPDNHPNKPGKEHPKEHPAEHPK